MDEAEHGDAMPGLSEASRFSRAKLVPPKLLIALWLQMNIATKTIFE